MLSVTLIVLGSDRNETHPPASHTTPKVDNHSAPSQPLQFFVLKRSIQWIMWDIQHYKIDFVLDDLT